MKYLFPIIILLVLFLNTGKNFEHDASFFSSFEVLDKAPEFYVLKWKEGSRLIPKKTSFYIEVDSIGKQPVLALIGENQKPVLYTANINTPVCADGECKLMNIRLYWTLLGEYAGFDRFPEMPLTKHDHDEFEVQDYQKLHTLLADDKSILGRRSINQLVEKPKLRSVNGVDAVAGATIARVKEAIVSGALYSCYTVWKIVHSDIREQLKHNSLSVLDDYMIRDMLYSINDDYQLFALEKIEDSQYQEHYKQIVEVFKTSTPLVRSIIAKRITSKYKDTPTLQKPFWEAYDIIDSGSKSTLINFLDEAPSFVTMVLSSKLKSMSSNQLKKFLGHLKKNEKIGFEVKRNLEAFSSSDSETYAYIAREFLEENAY